MKLSFKFSFKKIKTMNCVSIELKITLSIKIQPAVWLEKLAFANFWENDQPEMRWVSSCTISNATFYSAQVFHITIFFICATDRIKVSLEGIIKSNRILTKISTKNQRQKTRKMRLQIWNLISRTFRTLLKLFEMLKLIPNNYLWIKIF